MRQATLVACCAVPVIVAVDFAVVSVVVPQMRRDLTMGDADVRWVFSGYSLGFGALLLPAGRAADAHGHGRMLILGVATFALGAAALAAARTGEIAVAARVVQGAGAALASPAALALLTASSLDGAERARATAAYGLAICVGFVAGTLLSGILATIVNWRLGAALVLPLCVIAGAAAVRGAGHASRGPSAVTPPTAVVVACLVTTGALGATAPGWLGLTIPVVVAGAVIAVAGRLGRSATGTARPMATGCAAGLVVTGTGVGATLLLTLFMQDVRGYTPLETGCALAFFGLAAVPGARTARRLAAAGRPGVLLGTGLAAQGGAFLAAVTAAGTGTGFAIVVAVAGFGFGHVIGNASAAAVATAGAPIAVHGVLAGMLTTAQYLGGALGPSLLARVPADNGLAVFQTGMATCGAVALLAAIGASIALRRVRWAAA